MKIIINLSGSELRLIEHATEHLEMALDTSRHVRSDGVTLDAVRILKDIRVKLARAEMEAECER